jgi:biopolymer transport protein ExbD
MSTNDASESILLGEEPIASLGLRRPRDEAVDMDITPMIDMTFLLLIFFLVSSTPDELTAIDLPKALYGRSVSQRESTVLTIGMGGVGGAPVYAADGRVAGTELAGDLDTRKQQIRELIQKGIRDNKENVVIKADKNVAHRDVARVVKAASGVADVQIHLAVLETE